MNQDNIFDKVKAAASITAVVEHFGGLKLRRNGTALCPFHSEKNPSFSVSEGKGIYTCFSCGKSGDAINFVSSVKGIEPLEAAKLIAQLYNITEDGKSKQNSAVTTSKRDMKRIKDYLKQSAAASARTEYFKRRGLTDDTVRRFCLGYDEAQRVVVIPYSSKLEYYQTRSVDGKQFRKPKTEEAGTEPLYNGDILSKAKGAVFVVESPLCAISIMQCGGAAVAVCGTTGGQKLINSIKTHKPKCTFVLCLDNDDPGRTAQQDLANRLFEEGVKFTVQNISEECNDPNELLMKDPERLTQNVKTAIHAAKKEFSNLKKLFSMAELQTKELKPTRWIVNGLLPEGLAILSAPSKYGKSWMMMQLCLAVTSGKPFLDRKTEKCDCVYYSLEDSKRRFKDRLNMQLNKAPAPQGFLGAVEARLMSDGLFDELTELVEARPNLGLIIIDTLQKVRGGGFQKNESMYGSDYREMGEFKSFADKHGICILLVHHLRKQSDDSDVFNRISGSMGIMGVCDTAWILARKKRGDANTTLSITGREVEEDDLVLAFDKSTVKWELIGNADREAARFAKAEYENNPVIKTIKMIVQEHPHGWRGNCSEIKTKIYEKTGALYTKSAESVGKAIRNYEDRLLADGILHKAERGRTHLFAKKQRMLYERNG